MYKDGFSLKEIAGKFNVTRQNVSFQLIKHCCEEYRDVLTKRKPKKNNCAVCRKLINAKSKYCSLLCFRKDHVGVIHLPITEQRKYHAKRKRAYYATENGRKVTKFHSRQTKLRHRNEYIARYKLNNEIKKGNIFRPKNCEQCGAFAKIHGHHKDYSKPLEVNWLCSVCHAKEHLGV
jgi:hypothetical protein